jgi:hypothetical protein
VSLRRPEEGVVARTLVLLPLGTDSPSLVVRERVSVLLEERVDARDSSIPRVLEILERETTVLRVGLLALEGVLGPDTGGVEELCLPSCRTRCVSEGTRTKETMRTYAECIGTSWG